VRLRRLFNIAIMLESTRHLLTVKTAIGNLVGPFIIICQIPSALAYDQSLRIAFCNDFAKAKSLSSFTHQSYEYQASFNRCMTMADTLITRYERQKLIDAQQKLIDEQRRKSYALQYERERLRIENLEKLKQQRERAEKLRAERERKEMLRRLSEQVFSLFK